MTDTAGTAVGRIVAERRGDAPFPLWVQPEWAEQFPWLVQGTTGSGERDRRWDFGLAGREPVGEVLGRWSELRRALGMKSAVHSRQVHGAELCTHGAPAAPGLHVTEGFDGHLTATPGVLLTVTVADCIPVSLVDPGRRAVAMVHAGWRGVAADVVKRAIRRLAADFDSDSAELWMHCGPAICGSCYEVGPEVHRAVQPQSRPPSSNLPIDLRAAVVERAVAAGLLPERITVSAHCTRCGPGAFFSHRGKDAGRQLGVLGIVVAER